MEQKSAVCLQRSSARVILKSANSAIGAIDRYLAARTVWDSGAHCAQAGGVL